MDRLLADSVTLEPGRPAPLGARWDGKGVNFALFSGNAERVDLCLFDPVDGTETARHTLREYTDSVWHGYMPGLGPGAQYGYRVFGPYDPAAGHFFNHHKLLIDPYARALSGPLVLNDTCFGYGVVDVADEKALRAFDDRDSAPFMPRCVVVAEGAAPARGLATAWASSVVYEMHVKGMTRRHPAVPEADRGLFRGLRHEAVIDHIRALGITAVELLPIHALVDERHLVRHGLRNYWGYNSVAFFAPEPRYLGPEGPEGFRDTVRAFHDAGIEVILDVVYNHTGEGDVFGPTLAFRGIDNRAYYRSQPGQPGRYADTTGCGNSLNVDHPRVRQMIVDSLRYWVEAMGVDGFRFDLAPALARERGTYRPDAPLLAAMGADPVLSGVKLIAEPWDVGAGGYQLGAFPQSWSEWNDQYRDEMRRFWRGYDSHTDVVASRLSGSSDIFGPSGRPPMASVNFIAAHDGFTLQDLVSYNAKHNRANMEGNRDGKTDNYSDNHGVEGDTTLPDILAARRRSKRSLVATLMLSQGVPMFQAGDEIGRTQGGNNNAYCQDNETSWLDWEGITDFDRQFHEFVRRMIAFRRDNPAFRRDRFFQGRIFGGSGLHDIIWLTAQGRRMNEIDWTGRDGLCFGFHIVDDLTVSAAGRTAARYVVYLNAELRPREALMPAAAFSERWRMVLDTAREDPFDCDAKLAAGKETQLEAQSLAVFRIEREPITS